MNTLVDPVLSPLNSGTGKLAHLPAEAARSSGQQAFERTLPRASPGP